MPRRNKNARSIPGARQIKQKKQPRAVMVWVDAKKDNISPGRLVAAAEWR